MKFWQTISDFLIGIILFLIVVLLFAYGILLVALPILLIFLHAPLFWIIVSIPIAILALITTGVVIAVGGDD